MINTSLYLHIPFCRHKCSYCDFNTYAGLADLIPAYVEALCREAVFVRAAAGRRIPVHTIFFGGGTPSLLSGDQVAQIITALDEAFEIQPDAEITMEANPGTLSVEYLMEIRKVGINRLSLGMQSASPEALALLEREHAYPDVIHSVSWARQAGFANLSLDLIFGLPHQTLSAWQNTLEHALALNPDHLSLYALSLEHGTPLRTWVDRGLVGSPDPDLAAEMYEWATERLAPAGFGQYEISNWARFLDEKKLDMCRHNLQYWRNLPYLGLGAGAHGFIGGYRPANVLAPGAYIKRIHEGEPQDFPRTPATGELSPIDAYTEMQETMLMGLRLTEEGVSSTVFQDRFGARPNDVFKKDLEELARAGLITLEEGDIVRLTVGGRLLGNQVFMRFV